MPRAHVAGISAIYICKYCTSSIHSAIPKGRFKHFYYATLTYFPLYYSFFI